MKIEVTNQKPAIAAAIKKTAISMADLMSTIDDGYGKIMGYLAELGKQPVGAPYICYTNGNEDFSQFDMEMGMPVAAEIPAKGEIFMSKTYEGKAIETTHKGAYAGLEAAYGALMEYAKENSLELAGVYYDFYLNNPDDTPENELLTKVVFPIN